MSANNWTFCPICQSDADFDTETPKLREDWYIRADGYKLKISYSCNCVQCNATYTFVKNFDMKAELEKTSDVKEKSG